MKGVAKMHRFFRYIMGILRWICKANSFGIRFRMTISEVEVHPSRGALLQSPCQVQRNNVLSPTKHAFDQYGPKYICLIKLLELAIVSRSDSFVTHLE